MKRRRSTPHVQGTFYDALASTWLEIAGFDPLSKHGLDLGLFYVLIVCFYKACCLWVHKVSFASL